MEKVTPSLRSSAGTHVHLSVTRIFLKQKVSSRKRAQYSEGWIEMADRHLAKQLALLLNNQPMFNAGQKKKFYSQELWNLKYLKRVKWHDVTDQFGESTRLHQLFSNASLASSRKAGCTQERTANGSC
jgi:ESF2/ABP1 family protein